MDHPLVTLTTDFGYRDPFVGVIKGVILAICPQARLVDITHDIAARDVLQAAFLLEASVPYFPQGTIHLAVVDPGVGTVRKPVALATPRATFVGPDNGIFGLVWKEATERFWPTQLKAAELTEKKFFLPEVSGTFHGRDIFAPVAAHLARGVSLQDMGPALHSVSMPSLPHPVRKDPVTLVGEVVHIDRFGNCLTNVTLDHLRQLGPEESLCIQAGEITFGSLRVTYATVPSGTPVAIIGSTQRLELALRDGNLSHSRGFDKGTAVTITRST